MDNSDTTEPIPRESAQMIAEIDAMLAEMAEADRRIAITQKETARLQAETRAILTALTDQLRIRREPQAARR